MGVLERCYSYLRLLSRVIAFLSVLARMWHASEGLPRAFRAWLAAWPSPYARLQDDA